MGIHGSESIGIRRQVQLAENCMVNPRGEADFTLQPRSCVGTQRSRCSKGVAPVWVKGPLCSLKAAFPGRRRLRLPSERSVHAAAEALHLCG